MGAKRVVLAREISLENIKEIREKVPDIELEVFVHGAMCMAISGRCLLSNYMTGRDANRGDCAQACRWSILWLRKQDQEKLCLCMKMNMEHIFLTQKICVLSK